MGDKQGQEHQAGKGTEANLFGALAQNDITVSSWAELCDRLFDNSWQPDIGRFRSNYAFRGVADSAYDMSTSFQRNCGELANLEYHLLRNFRKYAQIPDAGKLSDWRCMTIAQHHGLPTRLLDWTYSPFVALHFATANPERYDLDAAIWHMDFIQANRLLPPPLRDALDEVGANAFTMEMLERTMPTVAHYDKLSPKPLVLFFEPPSLDARIVNQFAFFSVMSGAEHSLLSFLLQHPGLYRRIIIPAKLKWEVRDKLDQANITERMLFPGLDGLAAWLARHYRPTPGTQTE